jgi:hypothetical protein
MQAMGRLPSAVQFESIPWGGDPISVSPNVLMFGEFMTIEHRNGLAPIVCGDNWSTIESVDLILGFRNHKEEPHVLNARMPIQVPHIHVNA